MVDELNKISEQSFDIKGAAWLLMKKNFAYGTEWDNEAKRDTKLVLRYPIERYQEILKKIDDKKLAYIPEELIIGDYRDLPIRGKIIWGVGTRAIALVDGVEYHEECAHPRTEVGKKGFINYKKDRKAAEKLAKEILEKYGKR